MMTRRTTIAGLALLVAGGPALAHHSGAMYDSQNKTTIDGVVKTFEWTNPHVVLRVTENPRPGSPEKTWDILATSPGNLTRAGWTKRTFKEGDRVTVVVSPLRNGDPGGAFVSATLIETGQQVTEANIGTVNGASNLK
jgi:hypothetical protein